MIAGTLPYMAPEQFQARTPTPAPTSTPGVPATSWRRECALCAEHAGVAVQAIPYQPPVRPTTLVPELSANIEEVILKALEKDAGKRHASAGDIVVALRDMGTGGRPYSATAPS
jgi:hypothetical protein